MPRVVTDACIRCKYMDCVDVCPVGCFHEGETMLVINPEQCIDCGVCESECPIEAIFPDTDERAAPYVALNREYAEKWPLAQDKNTPKDADEWKNVPNKYPQHFSKNGAK